MHGNYSLQNVARELRAQWDDHNLRQREGHRTHTGYLGAITRWTSGRATT